MPNSLNYSCIVATAVVGCDGLHVLHAGPAAAAVKNVDDVSAMIQMIEDSANNHNVDAQVRGKNLNLMKP